MALASAINSFSFGFQAVLASSAFGGIAEFASLVGSVRESRQSHSFLGHLRNRGVAVSDIDDLQDRAVQEAIIADPDLSVRVRSAFDQITDPGVQVIVRGTHAAVPWPATVTRHFKEPTRHGQWLPRPDGFHWEQALRDYSRSQNEGRLVYPKTLDEKREWRDTLIQEHRFGERVGSVTESDANAQILAWLNIQRIPATRTLFEFNAERLGFEPRRNRALEPGDLVSYRRFFTGAAILTQVNTENEAIEVLLPRGLSLFLTCPINVGSSRRYFKLNPLKKPDYLVVSKGPFELFQDKAPKRLKEIRDVAASIHFKEEKFRILRRGEGGGLTSEEWLVDFDFANGDWAIFHLGITGKAKRRTLRVIVDYSQRLRTDPPDYIAAAERTLIEAAKAHGFRQLLIAYKMIYPMRSQKFEEELRERAYAKKLALGWGHLPGKRITLKV